MAPWGIVTLHRVLPALQSLSSTHKIETSSGDEKAPLVARPSQIHGLQRQVQLDAVLPDDNPNQGLSLASVGFEAISRAGDRQGVEGAVCPLQADQLATTRSG